MSSPFSKQMSQTITRLSESINPQSAVSVQIPSSISTPVSVESSLSEPRFYKKYFESPHLKNPYFMIPIIMTIFLGILYLMRKRIWKDEEKRPTFTKLILYILVAFIPVITWVFFQKRKPTSS
jgi:hypothetical protein